MCDVLRLPGSDVRGEVLMVRTLRLTVLCAVFSEPSGPGLTVLLFSSSGQADKLMRFQGNVNVSA